MAVVAAALLVSSCASKKDLQNCQAENRQLSTNYQNTKEQLAAAQARVTSLEDQLAQQKKDYAALQRSLDKSLNNASSNNINISNMGFESGAITTTSMDLNSEDDYKLPIFSHYYFFYNGEFVKVHERDISRVLPKDKDLKRKYRTIIGMDDFSWNSDNSLMKLLKAITVKEGEQ